MPKQKRPYAKIYDTGDKMERLIAIRFDGDFGTVCGKINMSQNEYGPKLDIYDCDPGLGIQVEAPAKMLIAGPFLTVAATTSDTVKIIETDDAELFIGREGEPWYQTINTEDLDTDCKEYLSGAAADWGIGSYDETPDGNVIASWTPNTLTIYRNEDGESLARKEGRIYLRCAGIELNR